jgi:hypothetical protein
MKRAMLLELKKLNKMKKMVTVFLSYSISKTPTNIVGIRELFYEDHQLI